METMEFQGRKFKAVQHATFAHDIHLMNLIRSTGMDQATIEPGESPEQFGERLIELATRSPHLFEILGALIIPDGVDGAAWTREMGVETAQFLAGLTDDESKRRLHAQIASLVVGFFVRGLSSAPTSPRSSTGAADLGHDSESEDITITAIGG